MVTFSNNRLPKKEPEIPETVAINTNCQFSAKPDSKNLVAYMLNLVKSTHVETSTVVPTKASFDNPDLIKKAARSAPWFPVRPPKKPLNIPPKGNFFLLNCKRLKYGI